MRLFVITILLISVFSTDAAAQKYLTKNGHIRFYSAAALENIEADNHQVTSILDSETGEVVFSLLMKGFHFEKALMEEHFNEKYVHSDKFPKSTFKGSIPDLPYLDLASGEAVTTTVSGILNLHGIDQKIIADATLQLKDGKVHASSTFPLTLADFDIKIPGVVKDNIAKIVEVTVEMIYEEYNK